MHSFLSLLERGMHTSDSDGRHRSSVLSLYQDLLLLIMETLA